MNKIKTAVYLLLITCSVAYGSPSTNLNLDRVKIKSFNYMLKKEKAYAPYEIEALKCYTIACVAKNRAKLKESERTASKQVAYALIAFFIVALILLLAGEFIASGGIL